MITQIDKIYKSIHLHIEYFYLLNIVNMMHKKYIVSIIDTDNITKNNIISKYCMNTESRNQEIFSVFFFLYSFGLI